MKQILCVVDLAESTGRVLEVAAKIATAYQARLVVLFPYRLIASGYNGEMSSLKAKLESEAKGKFHALRKTLSGLDNLSAEFLPEIGFVDDRIKAHINKGNVDLIVIGQYQGDSTKDVKGYNLETLITNSQLPVVIVPAEVNAPVTA